MNLHGHPYSPAGPADAMTRGIAYLPADRNGEAAAVELTLRENLYLNPAYSMLSVIRNTEEIFELNRIRSAERRLLMLLRWLGINFGQVSSRGYRLSLKEMNLTHRSLAEICGLTRVTVTKNLNRYKTLGLLQNIGEADLFIPGEALASAF
jgi:CRP-like cAMP-binding protein